MSRICVKGIGKNANEQNLRDLFSTKGEVTDVKLLMTKDGKPRKIAFIGFRTDVQANEAQKYFNNTFMGLSKIVVEIAKKVNDQTLLDAKLKHQKKGKDGKPVTESEDKAVVAKKEKDVKQAAQKEAVMSKNKVEFMEVMKNRRNAKFWTNDDVVGNDNAATVASSGLTMGKSNLVGKSVESRLMVEESDSDVSDSDMNDFSSNKSAVKTALKLKSKANNSDDSGDDSEGEEKTAVKAAGMSDLDYLKSKMSTFVDSDDEEAEQSDSEKKKDTKKHNKSHKQSHQSASDNDDSGSDNEMEVVEKPKKITTKDRLAANKKRSNSMDSTNSMTQFAQQNDTNNSTKAHPKAAPITLEDDIEDSSRLFVKNLPFTCTEEEFSSLFEKYGVISEVHLPIDKEKKGKGFGFIHFLIPEHATIAMNDLSGSSFQGRLLHITKANRKKDYDAIAKEKAEAEGTSLRPNSKLSIFQQKKEEERKKFANKQEGWNSAFVRSDTVVESLADKYGISRSAILDTSEGGGELAVRLAIGETQVITENREYFLAHGVDISALESVHSDNRASKRSTTTILVKNLPYDLVEDEVESMFARFGTITAFLVPKSRTIALVDFVEPTEARAAYKGLAYRSYKHMPMYLEWAPVGVIDKDKATAATTALKAKQNEVNTKKNKTQFDKNTVEASAAVEDNLDEYSTLFIKNLNFVTTEENLKDHCNQMHIDGWRTIHIQKKQIGNSILSQGYGFAEFSSHKAAQDAMVKLNGSLIDSHALVVKPSDKRLTIRPVTLKSNSTSNTVHANAAKNGQVQTPGNNKLIVRNVAFQATKHEIRALFSAFGSIKRVRIPKKMGGDHRGFAFVDFSTAQEAATAMASLKDTHLYGRHLVLEWAKEEDEEDGNGGPLDVIKNIDALRKRARADETVIRTDHKNKRAKETIDESMGGPGSDDI